MRKKLFAMILVVTLIMGSNMPAYAADDDVTSPRSIVIIEYDIDKNILNV